MKKTADKWVQHNQTTNWSAGNHIFILITSHYFAYSCRQGLGPVVYSIDTSVSKTTNKMPFEIVFGQRPKSDFQMWKIIRESSIDDEENLPNDFIHDVNECKFYIKHSLSVKFNFISFFLSKSLQYD